jgi:hypothetical protein
MTGRWYPCGEVAEYGELGIQMKRMGNNHILITEIHPGAVDSDGICSICSI